MDEVPLVVCKSQKDLSKFFHEDNKKFLNRLCRVIEEGVDNKLQKIILCDITYDGVTKFRINIYKKDYEDALLKLLKLYEKLEEYEKCTIVKSVIKKIK
jgi:hypothetical protein